MKKDFEILSKFASESPSNLYVWTKESDKIWIYSSSEFETLVAELEKYVPFLVLSAKITIQEDEQSRSCDSVIVKIIQENILGYVQVDFFDVDIGFVSLWKL